jgi:sugar lactone lactonase YvrE
MVFAPNGDLYFGTVSTAPGQRSQGLWRIPGVAQAGVRFNRPVNVLPGSRFAAPPNGLTGVGVAASAFMTAGPFAGQMLVREEPRVFELAGAGPEDPGDRLLRLPPPGFMAFEELIPQGVDAKTMLPIRLDGVAVNSEGDIFSTDVKQNRVLRHGPDGSLKGIFAVVKSPNLLAVGPDDLVYVTNTEFPDGDTIQGGVFVYDPQGNLVGKIDQPLALLGVAVCRN